MKRFLVTGAQGFVGRHLVAELLEADPDALVVGVGRSAPCPSTFSYGMPLPSELARRLAATEKRYRYMQVPLDETAALNAVVSELAPECVFHLASALHTAEPQELFRTNVEGTLALLNALEGHDALVVHGSSASVYGEAEQLPIREDHPCVPTNLYGLSKRTAEAVVAIKRTRYVVARIFNIVGPGQTDEHVCGRFARDLVSLNGNSVLRVGPLSATRDFIDVRDVASALLALVSAGEHGHAYNVASGVEVSIREMLKLLAHASGSDARIEESRRQARGVSRNVADISRIQKLGWAPRYSLGQSLSDLMAYQRQCTRPERDDVPRKFSSI